MPFYHRSGRLEQVYVWPKWICMPLTRVFRSLPAFYGLELTQPLVTNRRMWTTWQCFDCRAWRLHVTDWWLSACQPNPRDPFDIEDTLRAWATPENPVCQVNLHIDICPAESGTLLMLYNNKFYPFDEIWIQLFTEAIPILKCWCTEAWSSFSAILGSPGETKSICPALASSRLILHCWFSPLMRWITCFETFHSECDCWCNL